MHEVSEIPLGTDLGFADNPGVAGLRYAAVKDLAEKLGDADVDIACAIRWIRDDEED